MGDVLEVDSDDLEEVVPPPKFDVDISAELAEENSEPNLDDPERLTPEQDAFPLLPPPVATELSGARAKVLAKAEQDTEKEVALVMRQGDTVKAIETYTQAMVTSGATPLMLAKRGALLLKQKRPCAAIRDCTAAIKLNANIMMAYRIRGIAHRLLGHWKKAARDLSEAQSLNFDDGTAEVQRFVNKKIAAIQGQARPKEPVDPAPEIPVIQAIPSSGPTKDFDKGQAVVLGGLVKAPHLNGRRGVVQGPDPRPAQKGRWEVEVRLEEGRFSVKSIKAENILTLNKADKGACKAWVREERLHQQARKLLEDKEQRDQYAKCVQNRMVKLKVSPTAQSLLRQLDPEKAIELLDRVGGDASGIVDVNQFLANQAKLLLGASDSEDEPEGVAAEPEDKDLLQEEKEPFPALPAPAQGELADSQRDLVAVAKQEATCALEQADVTTAIGKYTEAMEIGGATALLLTRRGELLLGQRRPLAAIRDCTAAIEANAGCGKAFRIRGIARRRLGQWEEALADISAGQRLDFDEGTVKLHNLVALKVNDLQERGASKRRASGDGKSATSKAARTGA